MLTEFASAQVAIGGVGGVFLLFFAMAIGHAFADYPLQGTFLAIGKNRHLDSSQLFGGNDAPKDLWIHALSAHSLIHSGFVWAITGSGLLALVEFILHWITDFIRCERWISYSADQGIHFSCKLIYAVVLVWCGEQVPF
ncbi:MAG: DUF3307 domain-containing protein [Akkermansiaceae bacterium]|jgi:hypothetical protein|nr:DUF3307 domain-containing protein [Akkermansiaceae bacterium]MDP4647100.1 DUF3307 domain-containing protein [Akkermansiaceae bacterium]MDP4722442.1 DUF3307 domain-containing protein [Akkermansiaceae bacterium]MDP4780154.1 DUF3307 domain-containing protein [Akkermansiaceae bacterium]MDP4847146.1 DUF3307 domain-containing protein [Akkermansiaceae bacterium]